MQDSIHASTTELAQLRIQLQQAVPANNEVEAQMSSLRADLAQAQQDAEYLRTSASINAVVSTAPTENESKSVAEQVAEHVEAVRVELESRHSERVKVNDETLEKRTNIMKAQLSKKLTDGKAQLRQSLTVEHEQALQAIRADHEKEMSRLQARHLDEIEELRQSAESKFAKLKDEWNKGHQATNFINGDASVKDKGQPPRSTWQPQPSEDEARALIQSNEIVRGIVKKNIGIHVNKAKEELSTQLKQDHERAMTERTTEIQDKANTAKEHAVLMEGKKSAVQINVANNKARMLQYRVDIIQKAAQDTPLKPVAEVWLVAKDARPPPVIPQPPQQPQQETNKAQQTPQTSTFGKPTALIQNVAQQGPTNRQGQSSGVSASGRPTAAATASGRQSPAQPASANVQGQQPGISTFGRPTPAVSGLQAMAPSGPQSPAERPSQSQPQPKNDERRPKPATVISQPGSNSPPTPALGATNHHPNAGTGAGVLRGLQQSGLPVARGGLVRGNPMSRVRGSAMGRGGPQVLDTSRSQGQQVGRGSPTSAGLNAGAKQFVPGNKRPRDDGQDGGDGGNGKKIRGGGGSA